MASARDTAWCESSPTRATTCTKSSRYAAVASVATRESFVDEFREMDMDLNMDKTSGLETRVLPGHGASAAHQAAEHLAAGFAHSGELGQIGVVGESDWSPAAAEQRSKALSCALAGAVRVEHTVDGRRGLKGAYTLPREMRPADGECWQLPADRGKPVKRALHQIRRASAHHMLQAKDGLLATQGQVLRPRPRRADGYFAYRRRT